MISSRQISIILGLPLLALLWVLFGWNQWNGDREAYELYYTRESLSDWGVEIGYGALNLLGNNLGLSYQAFQISIAAVTLTLLYRYLVTVSRGPLVSLVVYAVCFFALDYVLVRNFLAFVILLQGFIILFKGGFSSKFRYLVVVIVATMVHQSSLVFLVFTAVPKRRVIGVGLLSAALLLFFGFYFLVRGYLPLPESISAHFSYYVVSWKSVLFNTVVHLLSVMLMVMVVWVERKSIFSLVAETYRERELVFILNVNFFSLFFVVLYFEAEIFIRLLRTIIFFNLLHCLNSLFINRKTYLFIVLYIVLSSFYLIFGFLWSTAELSVFPLFRDNILLG